MKRTKQFLSVFLTILMLATSVQLNGQMGLFSVIEAKAASSTVYKVVLTWLDTPTDLDSHLRGRDSAGEDFHIYYRDSSVYDTDGSLLAYLDYDDRDGHGPENVTVFRPIKGVTFSYFVYNYSNDARISGCGARVKVYKNDELLREWTAPRTNSDGRYWNIFQIKDGKFIERNKIEESEVFSEVSNPKKIFGNSYDYAKNIVFDDKGRNAYVSFKKEWFNNSTTNNYSYNHVIAQFCSLYCMFGYSSSYIRTCLNQIGFEVLDCNMSTQRDEVNYFIAAKTVYFGTERKTILFVGTIGSNGKQWYSNFDPYGVGRENGRGVEFDNHCGFSDARNFVKSKINSLFTNGQYGLNKENTILLFTGHSRGAATANLLAACARDELKWAHSDSIYAYTFATPNCTPDVNYYAQKYRFIYNIVNPEDMVTHVMLRKAWGYHKYGRICVLPSKTNTKSSRYKGYLNAMNILYKQYTDDEYEPYPKGEKATYKIIEQFNKNVKTIDDFYEKSFLYMGRTYMVPYDFFQVTLLPYVSGTNKSAAQSNMIDVMLYSPINGLYFKIISYFAKPDVDFSISHGSELGLGGRFEQAHTMTTYCAYMQVLNSSTVTSDKKSKYGEWNCPVDIEIYDNETNELVGRIVNNKVDEEVESKDNSVVMDVEGESKYFFLPADGDYSVKVIGNNSGTADYSLTTLESDFNETERVNYFDIDVSKNSQMSSDFESNKDASDIELLDDDDNVIDSSECFDDIEDAKRDVTVDVEGSGFVTGDGVANSGDYVNLNAVCQCSDFLGWYCDDDLMSIEEDLTIKVTDDIELTAKFSEGNHSFTTKVTEPTCENKGNTAKVCENCGLSEIISETDALGHDFVQHEAKSPTCEDIGWEEYETCTKCNYSTYVELPAYNHNFTIQDDYSNVSDNGDGTHTIHCSICNENGKTEEHTFEDGTRTEPTCTEDGYVTYLCSYCEADKVVVEEGTATGHNYINGYCSVCDEKDPSYVYPTLLEDTNTEVNIDKKGRCCYFYFVPEESGKYAINSNGDYDTYGYLYDSEMDEISYNDDSGDNRNFEICEYLEQGKTYIIGCCMYEDDDTGIFSINVHKHSYKATLIEPTCTEYGYTQYVCTKCNDEYKIEYVDPLGHDDRVVYRKAATLTENGLLKYKCSLCGAITSIDILNPKTIMLSDKSFIYNGKAQKPNVTVIDKNGQLINKSNYSLTYSSGLKYVGSYSVSIRFKGNFSGTKKLTYKINPKGTAVSKVISPKKQQIKVTWKKQTTQTTGYLIQYSTSKTFTKKTTKTVTVNKNKTTKKTINKLKSKKKYYVRVRTYKTVNGKKYYSSWSKAKSVKTK